MVNLDRVHEQVAAVEAAAGRATRRHAVIRELDRLAELLVGHSSPEVQGIKRRIQELVILVVPERSEVTIYIEVYCRR